MISEKQKKDDWAQTAKEIGKTFGTLLLQGMIIGVGTSLGNSAAGRILTAGSRRQGIKVLDADATVTAIRKTGVA